MATKTAILSVKIVSDAKDFSRKMQESATGIEKFQQRAKKLAVPATAVLAGLASIAVGFGKAAADAEQMQGGVNAVFGDMASKVDEFSKTSANRLGLSGAQYDKLAAQIGTALKSAGVPMDELAGKTDELTSLGADLASVFGGTTEDAVLAMGAAFRGEFDSLERFGYTINAASIQAGLMEDGLGGLTGAELEAAKKQEVLNQLLEQGAPYMGNFAKEANTATGQQERMTAAWADASAQLGTALLPAMTLLAEVAANVANWIQQNQGLATGLAIALGVVAGAVLVLNAAMWLVAANPIALAIAAIILLLAAFVGGIIYLATQTKVFQTIWAFVMGYVKTITASVSGFFKSAWSSAIAVGTRVISVFRGFVGSAVANIRNAWNGAFNAVRSIVTAVVANITGRINSFRSGVSSVTNSVRSFFTSAFNTARSVAVGAINGVISTVNRISSTVSSVVNSARSAFTGAFNTMRSVALGAINGVVGAINGISSAVQGAIGFVRSLFNMGGMPGWLSKVLGAGGTGFSVESFGATNADMGIGATGGYSLGTVFSGRSGGPTVNNYYIEVNGALDAPAVAKQIKSILNSDAQRKGQVAVGGSIW